MTEVNATVPHSLPQEAVPPRVKACIDRCAADYAQYMQGVQQSWQGQGGTVSFSFPFGENTLPVNGIITLRPHSVCLQMMADDSRLSWLRRQELRVKLAMARGFIHDRLAQSLNA